MEEISIQELYHILKKKIWIIIAITIVAVGIAGFLSFKVIEPEYKTFTTLMVGKPKDYLEEERIEYNDLLLNQKLVPTYGALVKSRDVSDKVINNLNLDMSFEQLNEKLNVNLVNDTEIIKLEVSDKDPELATIIANETAKVFMDSVKRLMKIENIQVIDQAQVPESPVSPKPFLNMAIAGVLGLMIGIFGIFLLEFMDTKISKAEELEKILEIPVLGSIPKMEEEDDKLISLRDSKSPISEGFRTMRTNIEFSNIDRELKSLIVTSSVPGEGKSTIAANLAITMARADKKILIVDCDLRKPRLNKIFNLTNTKGITSVLVAGEKLEDIIHNDSKLANLDILTSGPLPPNPAELMGSKKMENFIKELEGKYDTIILDTPPVGIVTDGVVLSTKVDGLIFVTAAEETDEEVAKAGIDLIRNVGTNIVGGVLNKMVMDNTIYSQYGYYRYYGEENM